MTDELTIKLTKKQALTISVALDVYADHLSDWINNRDSSSITITEEGKQLLQEILESLPELENKFKDF